MQHESEHMSDSLSCRRRRVLLVDPDRRTTSRLAGLLAEDGFEVEMMPDGTSAIARLAQAPAFDALVTELNLPLTGVAEVVRCALGRSPGIRIVVLTRYPNLVKPGRLGGAPSVLAKPLDYARLLELLTAPAPDEPRHVARLLADVDGC